LRKEKSGGKDLLRGEKNRDSFHGKTMGEVSEGGKKEDDQLPLANNKGK